MKELLKKVLKNKTLAIFLIFFAIAFPTAIYQKAEFEKRAILTSIGIDKTGDTYEFSGLMVVEENPMKISSNVKLVSSTGVNIAEAVYKLSLSLGKEIGLAHCDSVVVGEGLKDENIIEVLDYFIRSNNLIKNTNLIATPGTAKELLQVNTENSDENGITFAKLVSTGSESLAVVEMNIEEFYSRYFSKSKMAWVTIVGLEEGSDESSSGSQGGSSQGGSNGSGSSEQGGGGESGGSEQSQSSKKIKCDGSFVLYKKGKQTLTLQGDEANVLNILNPYTQKGHITIEEKVDDKNTKNLGISIVKKHTDAKYKFENGVPVVDITSKLYVKLLELETSNTTLKSIDATRTHISDEVKNAIVKKMQTDLSSAYSKAKENQVDMFSACDRLYKFKTSDYKKYVSEYEDENCFLENLQVNLNVKIEAKL